MTPLKLVYLQARRPLTKTVKPGSIEPYPMARRKTSHERLVYDLAGMRETMADHANRGHCLYMGLLDRPIADETRAGRTPPTDRRWLVLDFDRIDHDLGAARPLTADTVRKVAEKALETMPEEFRDTSYIAHASASMGLADKTASVHLFFVLDSAVPPPTIKRYLQKLNLETPELAEQVSLTKTGWGLRYKLDPVVNDNARELFIAPPQFVGVADPFASPDDRIVLVEKERELLPANIISDDCDPRALIEQRVKELRKASGLDTRARAKYREIVLHGQPLTLLTNPAKGTLTPAYENDHFCYYNLNGGDSRGYYHRKGKPEIIFNFKDEPPFRWVDIDPDGYRTYCAQNAQLIKEANPEAHFMVLNATDGTVRRVRHNQLTNEVEIWPDKEHNKEAFYLQHGMLPPDQLEYWVIEMDPRKPPGVDVSTKTINTTRLGALMYNTPVLPDHTARQLHYGNARLIEHLCPTIWKVLAHVLVHHELEINHFVNWLACIYQSRDKTGTGWVWQGVPGTGKGVLFHRVMRTIFGQDACTMLLADQAQEQFTGWRLGKLLVVIDEFEAKHMQGKHNIMDSRLKNWVTEPMSQIRAMHQEQRQERFFDNFLLYSNKHDVIMLEDGDRRWNVGPRQEVKLIDAHPEIVSEINANRLEEESDTFAAALNYWRVDLAMARRPLENEAKHVAKQAADTSVDEVANAIREGNLDYFIPLLEAETSNPEEVLALQLVKRAIRGWLNNPERASFIANDTMQALFFVCAGIRMHGVPLGKMLARKGLQKRKHHGFARGYTVYFDTKTLSDESLEVLQKTDNVVQFKSNAQ